MPEAPSPMPQALPEAQPAKAAAPKAPPAGGLAPAEPLLAVQGLCLSIRQGNRQVPAVDALSFCLDAGQTLALVGESGCGKSLSALSLMRLLPDAVSITGGSVRFAGQDLLQLPEYAMRTHRGRDIAMIFQEPGLALDPVVPIGRQIGEAQALRGITGREAAEEAAALLSQAGIADPVRRLSEYPFQLSGGMKQRVMIAMALAGQPKLLIADEPTTALDVTVQSQILDLLSGLQHERKMALLFITHDLGVVARMASHVGVMYAGQLVEYAPAPDFFAAPRHPYSQALFAAMPEGRRGRPLEALPGQVPSFAAMPEGCRFFARCPKARNRCRQEAPPLADGLRCWFADAGEAAKGKSPSRPPAPPSGKAGGGKATASLLARPAPPDAPPLLGVCGLAVHFPIKKGLFQRVAGHVRAVDGIDLGLRPGRTLALVGESGCGKTTAGKALMRLLPASSGAFSWQGKPVATTGKAGKASLAGWRQHVQMVFQDPFSSLDPRMRIGEILAEGCFAKGIARPQTALQPMLAALLGQVGLPAEALARYPHEFSGGQRQRIAIARALAVGPDALICDEPTSALDVSVQAQILNLLSGMQAQLGIALLFITHNFAVVEYLAHEVAVMYLGKIVETGESEALLSSPAHPYTQALLSAVPAIEGGRQIIRLAGEAPSPANPPSGCRFHPRCPKAKALCREQAPLWLPRPGGQVACHFPDV